MKRIFKITRLVCLLPILLVGCQPVEPASEPTTESTTELTTEPSTDSTTDPNTIDLQVGDANALAQLLEKHQGKVVVVDFWATWCPPCVKMFPHTVELANHFAPEEVAVIGVSMDEPDDKQRVEEFLQKHNAQFENLLSSYGVGSKGFDEFEIPNGSIPHFRVYDQAGNIHYSSISSEELESNVKELLDVTRQKKQK